ncbi:type IV secretion system protein VirB8 [Rubrivivax gelatinosus]|uniref:virB8 family protein n=1 Tax=Rubrivivax gelatinosus TaxID=28068 RepID=UPI001903C3CD|nr:type IV secretion system protein [Rubrivivax gelatinosus]MBK1613044.1 type IV secretion system protein VirB8 [Rubrivivax gelatinosus]
MDALLGQGKAAAWAGAAKDAPIEAADSAYGANREWELDRSLMLERSERRAWRVASAGAAFGLVGIAAVFVQGPLRQVVEIPIVVDRVTGETTIQQRLAVETIPELESLDKHNLAAFVRAREGYSWMWLQRDFDQVARMAVPTVFTDYSRRFDGDSALQKRLGATEEWRINIVSVRLAAAGRSGKRAEGTVTYEKVVRLPERPIPDVTTRHVASIVYEYQPTVLAKERDRLENPFGFVVTAYRSDPEINAPGGKP